MISNTHTKPGSYVQPLRHDSGSANAPAASIFDKGNILGNGWLIVGVAILVALLGTLHALTISPMYEANVLIQIRRSLPPSGELQLDVPAATEMEILRSRSILSRVVESLRLDISVEPKLFPVLGNIMAGMDKPPSAVRMLDDGSHVWGAQRVRVTALDVPESLLGQRFTLTVTGKDTFTLSQRELGIKLQGRAGGVTTARTRAGNIAIAVAEIRARPQAQFLVRRDPRYLVVDGLQRSLAIAEKGKLSNVIGVSLRGSQPELLSRILNEIAREYIQQQGAIKTQEARNQLVFYDQQIAESRQKLQTLDARLNQVLSRHGTTDLSEDIRTLAQQSVTLEDNLLSKQQRRIELLARLGDRHPEVLVVTRHIQDLQRHLAAIDGKRKVLAAAQQEIITVNREKLINNEMNIALLNTRHKLETLTLSNHVNVRLLDRAEAPLQATTFGLPVRIAIACLLGLALGVLASMLKNALVHWRSGGRDVEDGHRLTIGADSPESDLHEPVQKAV